MRRRRQQQQRKVKSALFLFSTSILHISKPDCPCSNYCYTAVTASTDVSTSLIAAGRGAGARGAIDVFCRRSLRLRMTLGAAGEGHTRSVVSLAFVIHSSSSSSTITTATNINACPCCSAPPMLLASCCRGGTVCVWNICSGTLLAVSELQSRRVAGGGSVSWMRGKEAELLLVVGGGRSAAGVAAGRA